MRDVAFFVFLLTLLFISSACGSSSNRAVQASSDYLSANNCSGTSVDVDYESWSARAVQDE